MPIVSDLAVDQGVRPKPLTGNNANEDATQSTFSSVYESQGASELETITAQEQSLPIVSPAPSAQEVSANTNALIGLGISHEPAPITPDKAKLAPPADPAETTGNVATITNKAQSPEQSVPHLKSQPSINVPNDQNIPSDPLSGNKHDAQSAAKLAPTSIEVSTQTARTVANEPSFTIAKPATHTSLIGTDANQKASQIRARTAETAAAGSERASLDPLELATKPSLEISTDQTAGTKITALPQLDSADSSHSMFNVASGATTPTSPIAPQTTSPLHMQQAPGSTITAPPSQVPAILSDAVSMADKGNDKVVVQLDPPELGRVIIDFKFDTSGLQSVVVSAENPEALKQLRHMHFELIQALEQNGLSESDLSFKQENFSSEHDRPQGAEHDHESQSLVTLNETEARAPIQQLDRVRMMRGTTPLDIKV